MSGDARARRRSTRAPRCAALAALLAVAGAAQAAPLVALAPVHGDAPPALTRQLQWEVCDAFDCESWPRVATRGAPDLAKARKLGVAGVLTGRVEARGKHRVVALSLRTTRAGAAPLRWRFRLDGEGRVDARAMRALVADVEARLGAARPRAAPEGAAPARAIRAAEPSPPPRAPPPAPAIPVDAAPPAPPARIEPQPPPPRIEAPPPRSAPAAVPLPPPPVPRRRAAPRDASAAAWLAADVGLLALRRELRFEGVSLGAALLREHRARAIFGPELRLELFPAAPFGGNLAGLGAFARYGRSVGLETAAGAGDVRGTELSRLAIGALWRAPPLTRFRIVFAPSVAYRSLDVTVAPRIPGLPDATLSGVRGGVDVQLHLVERVALFAGGGYVRWTTARDLIGAPGPLPGTAAFFPGGAAFALEAEGGVAVTLRGRTSLRVAGEYSATRYRLDRDPSGLYGARGARDTYAGATLLLRAEL
jgi:hypothetical protein